MLLNSNALKCALVAFVGSAVMLAGQPAKAQNVIDNFLEEMGLQRSKRAPIDYRERAPLVMPKSVDSNLPAPQEGPAESAAWPIDADIQAEREAERNKPTQRQVLRSQNDLRISRQELDRGRRAVDGDPRVTRSDERVRLTPEELQAARKAGLAVSEDGYVEPERRRLTDPPAGYRTPAATAAYQQGENTEKRRASRFFERVNPWETAGK